MTTKEIKLLQDLLGTSPAQIADGLSRNRGDVYSAMSGARDYPSLRHEIESYLAGLVKGMTAKEIKLLQDLLGTSPAQIADALNQDENDVQRALSGLRDRAALRREIYDYLAGLLKSQLFDAVWLADVSNRLGDRRRAVRERIAVEK